MANEANLIPFDQMPPERQKALSRKGGIASGKARRHKRARLEEMKLQDRAHQEMMRDLISLLREQQGLLEEGLRTELAIAKCNLAKAKANLAAVKAGRVHR